MTTIEDTVAALMNEEISGAQAIADLHAIVKAGRAGLRDEFAKAALPAVIAVYAAEAARDQMQLRAFSLDQQAAGAYKYADAMLRTREA